MDRTRVLLLPALLLAAGAGAGLASGSMALEGAFFGAAVGVAAALSPLPWMGLLTAPPLGLLALALSLMIEERRAGQVVGIVEALRVFASPPGKAVVIAALAGGVAFLQLGRRRGDCSGARSAALHAGLGLAAWLLWWVFTRRTDLWFLRFGGVFCLAAAGAAELALDRRRA